MPALFSKLCEGGGVITNCADEGRRGGCEELQEARLTVVTAIHRAVLQSADCAGFTSFISYLLVGIFMTL
jgi:hypothetical protein